MFLSILLLSFVVSSCLACNCSLEDSLQDSFCDFDFGFKVLIEDNGSDQLYEDQDQIKYHKFQISIHQTYRNILNSEPKEIFSPIAEEDCGLKLASDDQMVIFGSYDTSSEFAIITSCDFAKKPEEMSEKEFAFLISEKPKCLAMSLTEERFVPKNKNRNSFVINKRKPVYGRRPVRPEAEPEWRPEKPIQWTDAESEYWQKPKPKPRPESRPQSRPPWQQDSDQGRPIRPPNQPPNRPPWQSDQEWNRPQVKPNRPQIENKPKPQNKPPVWESESEPEKPEHWIRPVKNRPSAESERPNNRPPWQSSGDWEPEAEPEWPVWWKPEKPKPEKPKPNPWSEPEADWTKPKPNIKPNNRPPWSSSEEWQEKPKKPNKRPQQQEEEESPQQEEDSKPIEPNEWENYEESKPNKWQNRPSWQQDRDEEYPGWARRPNNEEWTPKKGKGVWDKEMDNKETSVATNF